MTKYYYIISIIVLALLSSCSDVKEDITVPAAVSIHGKGVLTPESAEFHGRLDESGLEVCRECHATNFSGGSSHKSCVECHADIAIHKSGILDEQSADFHGKYLAAANKDMSACTMCHGTNYQGGLSSPTCSTCHSTISVHKAGILDPASSAFHGKYMQALGVDMETCGSCHGAVFTGGLAAPTCAECHRGISVHQAGMLDQASPNFHGKYIGSNNIDLSTCSTCHGADYKGGLIAPSCITCHGSIDVHGSMTLETHGQYIADQGLEISTCSGCHGTNFEGGDSAPGCSSCHSSVAVHKTGLLDEASPYFHGKYFSENNASLNQCASCHGEDFSGGIASPGCTTCHSTINIHKDGIMDATAESFHGKYIANNNVELAACASCHGTGFTGGLAAYGCVTCHSSVGVHQTGYTDETSANFHGKYLGANSVELDACATCHGSGFEGGTASPTCLTCHATISVHKDGILDQNSDAFHGKYVDANNVNMTTCATCHGEDYAGGQSSPTCVTCHGTIGVHTADIMKSESAEFHGRYFKANDKKLNECTACHGSEYAGGTASPSCVTCHASINVHQTGLTNPSSNNFHGKFMADNNFELVSCTSCHGESFSGGMSASTCESCHSSIAVHQQGIITAGSPNFHGKYLISTNWEMDNCSTCHGASYSGGLVASTCNTCHSAASGPEACNTCHGDFNNGSMVAPPNDLAGESSTAFKGVGAHATHLYNVSVSENIQCYECHPEPESVAGHIDALPATIQFGEFTNTAATASYDFNNYTCSNTYCHGNFVFKKSESSLPVMFTADEMTGNNYSPVWNIVDGSQAACGTCHGKIDESGNLITALPNGHSGTWELNQCSTCHQGVVDDEGNIIDKMKHINGIANALGN
ncbi:MAG: hypothetical protein JW995_09940 [Melioribacteraceae bacterium]|nr:hypothetical protein [Melioribacteraceae bacterium]